VERKGKEKGNKKWNLYPEMNSYMQGSVRAGVSNFLGMRAKSR
jgi:hypothetical protein